MSTSSFNRFFSPLKMQSDKKDRILVMGATNRPSDLDTAALRRFPKRIYVGLPDLDTRVALISKLLHSHAHSLTPDQIRQLARRTDGYSGSDLNSLATEAAYGPIREKSLEDLKFITKNAIRPISYADFLTSLSQIKVTPPKALQELEDWNRMYGANS
jgi:SpoVK/Ycf46/Vps4 family AAA+-type ATPase